MIYLDHSATTPVSKEVMQAMLPYFCDHFGNPSSAHQVGQITRIALDNARNTLGKILHCSPSELTFTGSGTEANNLAIRGVAEAKGKGHIITSNIEHPSVKNVLKDLEMKGFKVSYLPVNKQGLLDPVQVKNALRPDTILISVMYANNEIGIIQEITKIGRIAEDNGIPFHCDAVQAAATLPLDVERLKVSLLTISAHKIYGPKGVGLLFVKKGVLLKPQILGGGQEHRRRAGTENVAGIIGMSKALELVQIDREIKNEKMKALRDFFITEILKNIPGSSVNGDKEKRLVNNINICFPGVNGESLLFRLDMEGICTSLGSACSAGSIEPSETLLNTGLTREQALSSIRFSLGEMTTKEEVEKTIETLLKIQKTLIH